MRTSDLDYDLPPDLIATAPAEPRDTARLLVVRRDTGAIEHRTVRDLPRLGLLREGDLMVVNRTRVLPAFFEAERAATGGRIRGLYLDSPAADLWDVLLESRGSLRPGEAITLARRLPGDASLELLESLGRGRWRARLHSPLPTPTLLDRIGHPPLPPYIRKARRATQDHAADHARTADQRPADTHASPGRPPAEITPDDAARYNTVYAREPGSVAAPTAGLHFTPRLLDELAGLGVRRAEVVLRVGLGTFEPIRTDDLADHPMHPEHFHVPPETLAALHDTRSRGGCIFVVGTTTIRALESLPEDATSPSAYPRGYTGETHLFIHPDLPGGFPFRFADLVMTNFHLPRSTLLAMIATLPGVGLDNLKTWYAAAIAERYRFYSYGDAMLLA